MDLTLFLVFILFSFMIYYLIGSIQSLIKEIKEVKNKCIKSNINSKDEFKVSTPDPVEVMTEKLVNTLMKLKTSFQ